MAKKVGKRRVLVLRTAPGNRSRGILSVGPLSMPAAIGRSGTTAFKREGDGGTPVADMKLLHGYVRTDRIRHALSPLRLRATRAGDLWCDEPRHASYNRPVKAPFGASHEEMMRNDRLYDICLVLDWNLTHRRRHGGSAIFFHLAHADYSPTEGCIALKPRDMLRILPLLRKGTILKVIK